MGLKASYQHSPKLRRGTIGSRSLGLYWGVPLRGSRQMIPDLWQEVLVIPGCRRVGDKPHKGCEPPGASLSCVDMVA